MAQLRETDACPMGCQCKRPVRPHSHRSVKSFDVLSSRGGEEGPPIGLAAMYVLSLYARTLTAFVVVKVAASFPTVNLVDY